MSDFFHDQVFFFVYVFSWNNEYILANISLKGSQKSYINFSNNTFQQARLL